MRKLLLTLIAMFMISSVHATERNNKSMLVASQFSDQTANDYIAVRAKSTMEWQGKSVIDTEPLYDLHNNLNGYVYTLSNGGYIITQKYDRNAFIVVEASFEGTSPYSMRNGQNVYLGTFNYYEELDGTYVDTTTKSEVNVDSLTDYMPTNSLHQTVDNRMVTMAKTYGKNTYVAGIKKESDIPSINQLIVSTHHCSPTAAADVVRYAYLYETLKFKTGYTKYETYSGYKALIRDMGSFMETGTTISGTVDSMVAKGLQDFLKARTNYTAWVKMYVGTELPSFATFKTYINADYPVLITFKSATFNSDVNPGVVEINDPEGKKMHTVAAFGYTSNGQVIVADPNTGYRTELLYVGKGYESGPYAVYRVVFNY